MSEQHGNFFINDTKASWQDVLRLRDLVKKEILEKYGVGLHEEVRIITNGYIKIQDKVISSVA